MKTVKTLDLSDAKKAITAMEKKAEQLSVKVVFCVVDSSNNIIILQRMDGAFIHSINLARAKAMTAINFQSFTGNIGKIAEEMKLNPLYWAGACESGFKGGMTVFADDKSEEAIGAVGVSGATQDQDDEIALSGIKAMELVARSVL